MSARDEEAHDGDSDGERRFDVAVVGGGVVGLAVARELALAEQVLAHARLTDLAL